MVIFDRVVRRRMYSNTRHVFIMGVRRVCCVVDMCMVCTMGSREQTTSGIL